MPVQRGMNKKLWYTYSMEYYSDALKKKKRNPRIYNKMVIARDQFKKGENTHTHTHLFSLIKATFMQNTN